MIAWTQLPESLALGLLALVQGLTEFLPISSSGHLVLTQSVLELEHPALALDVALHVGTLVSILVVYRRDVLTIVRDVFGGELRELGLLVVGSLPAALFGILFEDRIEAAFASPRFAAYGLLATAAILLVGESARRRRLGREPRELDWRLALAIGAAQALAILPGISRSGSTIVAGILCGLSPVLAARFSFLLAIPAILGAAVLKLPEVASGSSAFGPWTVAWAAALAALVGWAALRWLLAFLGRGAFAWFAVYCGVLASLVLVFL